MSHEAIYQVTRALQRLLHSQLTRMNSEVVVTLLPPGAELPARLGLNLYLYRVMQSPFTRNDPWPGDRMRPSSDQPAVGLHLNYLLTPLSTKPEQETLDGDSAHTVLGLAMLTLHEHPILNKIHMPGFEADIELPTFLLDSYQQIKICPVVTDLEDLSKIWAAINQPYRLSVAYEVGLVELTPTTPPPVRGGIVTTMDLAVKTLHSPQLTALQPASGALARLENNVVTPNDLQIGGSGLSSPGQTPTVRVGGHVVSVKTPPDPTDQALRVVLPTNLDAGPQADVRVTLSGRTSIPLLFTVRPWLSSLGPIRAVPDPRVGGPALQLTLKGYGFSTDPQAVRFDGPGGVFAVPPDAGGTDTQATVTIPPDLPNGIYKVQIVINDVAASVSNARTFEVYPLVDLPVDVSLKQDGGREVHEITVQGARLNGSDIRLLIDGVVYQTESNENANELCYTLGRRLSPGIHQFAVNVDGHLSRTVELEVQE